MVIVQYYSYRTASYFTAELVIVRYRILFFFCRFRPLLATYTTIQRILFVYNTFAYQAILAPNTLLYTTTSARLVKNPVRNYSLQPVIHCNIVCCLLL